MRMILIIITLYKRQQRLTGEIMAVKHKKYNVYGLQFHPESILTPDGLTIIKNFCEVI